MAGFLAAPRTADILLIASAIVVGGDWIQRPLDRVFARFTLP